MNDLTRERAQAFVNFYVARIHNSSFVTWVEKQKKFRLTTEFGPEGQKVTMPEPLYDELASMLLSLRIAIQNRDKCSVPKLLEAIDADPLFPDGARKEIKRTMDILNNYLAKKPIMQITVRDTQGTPTVEPMTHGQIFDLLMYGEYAHQNDDKALLVDRIKKSSVFEPFFFEFQCAIWNHIASMNYIKHQLRELGIVSETPELK